MPLRICSFTSNYYPYTGGLERYQHQLSLQLKKQDADVTIVTSNTKNTKLEEISEGIRIIRLPVFPLFHGRMPLPKPNITFFKQLRKILNINADAYHVNMRFYYTSLLGAVIGWRKKKPVLLIDHVSGYQTLHNPMLDFIGRFYDHIMTILLKPFVSKYYGVSNKVCSWLKKYNIKCSGIIYNGIDPDYITEKSISYRRDYSLSDDDIIVAFGGRIVKEKGVEYLADAFEKIIEKYDNSYLFIAGIGPELPYLKKKYAMQDRIIFLNEISYPHMMRLLEEADIVCIPSYYPEGLPTLILEGGLEKCALIATPRGGSEEVITSAEFGLVVPEKDSKALSDKISYLIDNPDIRKRIADKLHKKVTQDFSWQKIAFVFIDEIKNK